MKTLNYCCRELDAYYQSRLLVIYDYPVFLTSDGEEHIGHIKFCPFCGKELIITETVDN
jgi:hypothetical protein